MLVICKVAETYIDNIMVSTVDLVVHLHLILPHEMYKSLLDVQQNLLGGRYETMVFGGKFNQFQRRNSTIKAALETHNAVVEMINIDKHNAKI